MSKTRGFLLGKFMPPHKGHLYMCDVASGLVDELTVLVCTRDCEPIDGNLRYQWMKESVKGNVQIVHLHRDIPQEPSEHPDFWNIWRETIKELHPESIDLVFGSEDYVIRLASELGAEPFIIDKDRAKVPVSSTLIRSNPRDHWEYIPRAVRHFYQKRICLLGPESTGKSELSQMLAKEFKTSHVPEYGRTYDAEFKQGKNWGPSDFVSIAKGHLALQKQIAQHSGYVFFEDTDLLQTVVWSEYLLGTVPDEVTTLIPDWDFADFYLLLKPDIVWVDDGTRYSGDTSVRNWFFSRLEGHLTALKLPFQVVSGDDWSLREKLARVLVGEYLQKNNHQKPNLGI
jgi:HTH-type transcriptional regulator, transcriptional repressor of NAD biosynthesis genes